MLNASTTPTDWPAELTALFVVASSEESLRAVTASAPAVAVTGELVMTASAALSTTLTAITALMASEAPLAFQDEPPEEVAVASAVATIAARSRAETATDPALTVEPVIVAATALRRSLKTTSPPIAIESDVVTFWPCGISVAPSTGFHRARSAYCASSERSRSPSTPMYS